MYVIETDVAVLGAGLAGALMAKSLAEKGWRTLLVDRHRFPRHKVCGEFLSPEVRQTLDAAGLLDRVTALRPARVERARLISADGGYVDIPLPGIAMGLSRFRLDEALHEAAAAAGARVLTSAALGNMLISNIWPYAAVVFVIFALMQTLYFLAARRSYMKRILAHSVR